MKVTIEQQSKGQELYNDLIRKAWESASFKEELISNPRVAISGFIGKEDFKLNDDKELIVEDQTDESVIYLNIPQKPNLDNLELTDEELTLIAGGELAISGAAIAGYAVGFAVGAAATYLAGKYLF